MRTKYYLVIAACCFCIVLLIILAAFDKLAGCDAKPSTPAKMEMLGFDDYIERAQMRVESLEETIYRAELVNGKEEAYAFLSFMEKQGLQPPPDFCADPTEMYGDNGMKIYVWQGKMKLYNYEAFVSIKSACERVVEAKGFGDQHLFDLYNEKLNELNNGFPSD